MDIKDIIRKKRDKKELSEEELLFFISKYFKEEILEEQAAALLTLMYTNGITENEMAYLTNAMAETGKELELYKISNKIVDIHTIGGIGDKIVIILISIIASLNIPIAKVAGRELGMLDRLDSIPNYRSEIEFEEFKEIIKENGMGIIAEPTDMAPIENKMYRLRNAVACNDNIYLIAMSIMSQKIAVGARNIVFDITCGEDTYIKNYLDAKKLAKILIRIGKKINRNVKCIISDLNEPIGKTFGNLIEIKEIIECLNGNMSKDIEEMILTMGAIIISLSEKNSNMKENKKKILEVLENGKAYKSFCKLIIHQNGSIDLLKNAPKAQHIVPVIAKQDGFIEKIDIDMVRKIAIYLNAIRIKKTDILDKGAGIEFAKKIGEKVNIGEILAYIHTNNEVKIQKATHDIREAFKISEKRVSVKSRIIDIL